jgi:hypothetical protein
MTKTQEAIEKLNTAQRKAIKYLVMGKPTAVAKRKGWFYTDAKCRKDTSQVLCVNGLVQIDVWGERFVVKPTGMGKRVAKAL